jgi:putative membrane protein
MMFDHGTWMFGGWLIFLIVWLTPFIISYIIFADRFRGRSPSARELLDQAYARGELSRDEYLQKRNDIDGR